MGGYDKTAADETKMALPDRIRVTSIKSNGLTLTNIDALTRLRELGYERKSQGIMFRPAPGRHQLDFLASFRPAITSVEQYRELVSDERSDGPMHRYEAGMTLLMEKAEHKATGKFYYVIIDTGIGGREVFLQELQRIKSITIEPFE